MGEAAVYLFIMFAGAAGTMLYNWIAAVLRSLGNSVAPLIFLVISSVLNVILDIALVAWIPMGGRRHCHGGFPGDFRNSLSGIRVEGSAFPADFPEAVRL